MANEVNTDFKDIHELLMKSNEENNEITKDEPMSNFNEALEQDEAIDFLAYNEFSEIEDDIEKISDLRYRKEYTQEIQPTVKKVQFGTLIEITKQNFIQEVKRAPKDVYVILHLFQDYIVHCRLIDECLISLAKKFINHKFVKIQATRFLSNFHDSDCPAIIIYKNSKVVHEMIACTSLLGGNCISEGSIEWVFAQKNIWETELEKNPADLGDKTPKTPERRSSFQGDSSEYRGFSSRLKRKCT
ncbi:hypothetical protein SteCoe_1910 [Stentor coeruleus]|uniref:Phosducin domain-containing protein n=1 Tax=Stentor coeruleus TaxID=5963 RepID=A0A1R2D0W9_9CILI|nr:hypothetical protein SteCoe_1910 [Stentor coeruleus]